MGQGKETDPTIPSAEHQEEKGRGDITLGASVSEWPVCTV